MVRTGVASAPQIDIAAGQNVPRARTSDGNGEAVDVADVHVDDPVDETRFYQTSPAHHVRICILTDRDSTRPTGRKKDCGRGAGPEGSLARIPERGGPAGVVAVRDGHAGAGAVGNGDGEGPGGNVFVEVEGIVCADWRGSYGWGEGAGDGGAEGGGVGDYDVGEGQEGEGEEGWEEVGIEEVHFGVRVGVYF